MIVDVKKYQEFCRKALINCGVKEEAAEAIADCCVMTDMMGITTHGTVNLPKYVNKMKNGGIDGQATPEVLSDGPTWARLDGKGGFGMYNARYAMDMAMKKADEMGMAIVTITDSGHCGACVIGNNGNYRLTQQPFNGHKLSGFGSEGTMYTLHEMVKVKTIVLKNVF